MRFRSFVATLAAVMCLGVAHAQPVINYTGYNRLVSSHVKTDQVDYNGFIGAREFREFIQIIAQTDPETLPSKNAKLAFYINAYNALTIQAVLNYWPRIKSVKTVVKPDFAFFKQKIHTIGGKKVSLDEIEHQIIRPKFKEPRIHAALNCASVSCPPLLPFAFTPDALDSQLDRAFTLFANDPKRNMIDAPSQTIRLSKVMDWYKADFAVAGGPAKFMARFVTNPAKKKALETATEIDFLEYNWAINKADH
ncbi:MAG: DUF547 domain-containing protein [Myxococcota bacterium]|nr:DUF547 domain-containing protein [Myxococcota bacterium]